ncbi:unnamed protein product [Parnassius mnemosyne]|uniref:Uncharacterized protein n=1 Tax=Parnassius mnemosyne TaxID=213953 RepID=A0AAV1M8X4_9NEOP
MKYINNNSKEVTVPSLTSWVNTIEGFKLITNKLRAEIINEHLNIDLINTQQILESRTKVHVEKCAAIAYCSGWIAIKTKKFIFKKCKTCQNNLTSSNNADFHNFIIKKEYCGKRWLCYPTRSLFDFFAPVEHITWNILNKYAHVENIVKYIMLFISVHINLNFMKCEIH